jgi:septal ring factor EnvC (AmiA/AmiB activator)
LLHHPGDLKKKIADLDKSASAASAAAQSAKAEQAKLAKAKEDLTTERSKHEAAIARELSEYKAALAAAHAELDAVKKQAADLKSKAEADVAAASTAKAEAGQAPAPDGRRRCLMEVRVHLSPGMGTGCRSQAARTARPRPHLVHQFRALLKAAARRSINNPG